MRVVLAIPVAGLIAGTACGLQWPDIPPAWLVAALCGWTLLAAHAARVSNQALLAASAAGAFMIGGAALAADAWHRAWRPTLRVLFESIAHDARAEAIRAGRLPPEDDAAPVILSGVLRSDASLGSGGGVSLALDVEWLGRLTEGNGRTDPAANPARGGVLLTVVGTLGPAAAQSWRAGRRIRAPAELRRVARYLDPGVPDQERAFARRGIVLVGTIKSAALVTVTTRGSPPMELAARVRSFTRLVVSQVVGRWSTRSAGIVSAIVIGDRTGLNADVERRLQESGTYHVIAISGGNIALLAGATLMIFRWIGMLGRSAMLVAATGLVAYGFVVQGGASVNRAVLMAVVYFGGRAWDLRGPPSQALVLVAGVLVLADPLSIADAASLLTFGATAAIVSVGTVVPAASFGRVLAPAVALFTASLAAELALLPVAATIFSRVTFAGLVLNFGAIPLMAVAQFAGMLAVPLYLISPQAALVPGWLAHLGAEGLVRTADLVALAPWSTWRVAPPGIIVVAVYYVSLSGALTIWRMHAARDGARLGLGRRRFVFACVGIATVTGAWIALGAGASFIDRGDGQLHVTFIDVGQGDAALVRFPRGSTLLVDAGGLPGAASFDIGDRVVAPVLRRNGVRRLDLVALSHGDADHVAGAPAVIREFRPDDVWEGVPVPPHTLLRALHAAAVGDGARWTTVQRADVTDLDGVQLSVRHPAIPDWERQDVRNDDSIVLELRWRDVSFVFTGDIGRETEGEIAPLFGPAPLRVVKVPHHGSRTSSSAPFVRALAPDVAVISVGRSNNFGHPAREVLERYEQNGAAVFRTDRDGAVTVDTDGTSLDVHTYLGRSLRVLKPRRHEGHEDGHSQRLE